MVTNLLNSAAVQRLRGIIQSRYGKGLNLRFIVDSKSIDFQSATPRRDKDQLLIPILMKDHFLGLASIPDAGNIDEKEIAPLVDLVRMVLEPTLQKWYLETQPQDPVHFDFDSAESLKANSVHQDLGLGRLAKGAFLFSQNPYAIPRWSLAIHDSLERWAFLHFNDMGLQISSAEDLKSLGAVTLLIDNVSQLNARQEGLIADFLSDSDPQHEPLILLGSSTDWNQLSQTRKLDERIASVMSTYQIDLDRMPGRGRPMNEAIRLLLDASAAH